MYIVFLQAEDDLVMAEGYNGLGAAVEMTHTRLDEYYTPISKLFIVLYSSQTFSVAAVPWR